MDKKTCVVGIRTLKPNIKGRTIKSVIALGFTHLHIIFEKHKGPMGEVTNKLLDKMSDVNADYFMIIDDDIEITAEMVQKALITLDTCDAVSAMPIPDHPKLSKYYTEMYGRYKNKDIEPFTFSFALFRRDVIQKVRIDNTVTSREEHAFYKAMIKKGFKYNSVFEVYPIHFDKTPEIDAEHCRWYAKGMVQLDKDYKMSTIISLLLSPIEGIMYAILIKDFFGFEHTINTRLNTAIGAFDSANR